MNIVMIISIAYLIAHIAGLISDNSIIRKVLKHKGPVEIEKGEKKNRLSIKKPK